MNFSGRLSIRSKLVILLLLASFVSIAVVGYQGYRSARDALNEAIYNELTTLRAAKTQQVQAYFSDIHDQVLAFAENRTIIEALNEFRTAYHLAERESVSDSQRERLAEYYRREFIPRLRDRMGGEPEAKHYLPDDTAAVWLQYHYIAANPNDVGKKDELIRAAGDEGYYAQVHERYHESLRSLIKKFGYYDLFLIDPESGHIIYSVFKETDFATSLLKGPYASSNFAQLVKEVMRTRERGRVRFQDYDVYLPSYGAPAAFVAVTVFDGREIAGILALQVPSDELNNVMTSNREWESSGMGETGEVYLVGRNHLMRSDSRFLIQDRERYLRMLRDIGMPSDEIQRIEKNDTTILFQPVYGETVDLALSGKTGTQEVVDYRGVPVMSAYAPLRVHGMDWVILSEMDIAEVNRPIDRFRRHVMVSATILGVVITLLALLLASYITRPIHALVAGMRRVGAGE
ncbi:MAG TPA: adenylate/guanylate cyclase domain-containing protein, partial [Gammaproteobacteria bacterium]|nr:adenylate/guanylate cyclase domain-containing protein [Gammaproteobacteria bacterium]